jgi:hypothetical protein
MLERKKGKPVRGVKPIPVSKKCSPWICNKIFHTETIQIHQFAAKIECIIALINE